MPIAYSSIAGEESLQEAPRLVDCIVRLDTDLFGSAEFRRGFKASVPESLVFLGPGLFSRLFRNSLRGAQEQWGHTAKLVRTYYLYKLAALTNRATMSGPSIQLNGRESLNEEATNGGNDNGSVPSMRKSLHQNIIGKLRPLPFQYHWTVWFDKHSESTNYDNRLYILYEDVADIATFYRVYNNYPWDKVRLRDTIHIFRKGVKPVWEDPENRQGGCWTFRVPKAKSQAFFHEIAILCMANEFQAALESEHDHVLGVSTSVRFNSHLISVWNKCGSNERSIKALETTIIDRLSPELRPTGTNSYFYKRHEEHEGYQEAIQAAESTSSSADKTESDDLAKESKLEEPTTQE